MRTFASLVLFLAAIEGAAAQNADCRTITDATQRLACYDKAAAPTTKPAEPSKAKSFADPTLVDESQMKTRIQSICRGC